MYDINFPRITIDFESSSEQKELIRHTLHKILSGERLCKNFITSLPFVSLKVEEKTVSVFFLAKKSRFDVFTFFFEMISNWLIPGRQLNPIFFYTADFHLPDFGDELYTLSEVALRLENNREVTEIQNNFPILEKEIRLGITSPYYARRILEAKGFSSDQKTALILEYMAYLIKRLPSKFDDDVFTEMQHVLVECPDLFIKQRKSKHLSRIISITYLFRKDLHEAGKVAPQRRHAIVKLFREWIQTEKGAKRVLGILIGVHFLAEKEVLEDRHVLKAIRNYVPDVHPIEGSFFLNKRGSENISTFYLEIEKTDGSDFSGEEMSRLRRELPVDLKGRIQELMHPIFMPRNEEEIIRNALSLAAQIRFMQDPPQVFISFDEQTHSRLFFTVIFVRLIRTPLPSIQELFQKADTFLEYIHDWCRNLGQLRRRHAKEATVFRVALSKEMFLRGDHSIDLNKARQIVFSELETIIGDLRDFNGGMITKQNETLNRVRELLAMECGNINDLLVENFFYSIAPADMRSVIDPEILKTLFLMLLDVLEIRQHGPDIPCSINVRRELNCVYIMIATEDKGIRKKIEKDLLQFQISSAELFSVFIHSHDQYCLGYTYLCDDPYQQDLFCRTIEHSVEIRYNANPDFSKNLERR